MISRRRDKRPNRAGRIPWRDLQEAMWCVHLDKLHVRSNLLNERSCGTRHDVVFRASEIEKRDLHRGEFVDDIHLKHGSQSNPKDCRRHCGHGLQEHAMQRLGKESAKQ